MESILDKRDKYGKLLREIEEVGEARKDILINKLTSEAVLTAAEDESRKYLLGTKEPISKYSHILKDFTATERKEYKEYDHQYKRANERYQFLVELLNGLKFEIRLDEMIANSSNL
jgi:hypothetical protein